MNVSVYCVAFTEHVKRLESWPVRLHVFESPVSVSVIATVSTAVVPSATDGEVSAEV